MSKLMRTNAYHSATRSMFDVLRLLSESILFAASSYVASATNTLSVLHSVLLQWGLLNAVAGNMFYGVDVVRGGCVGWQQ